LISGSRLKVAKGSFSFVFQSASTTEVAFFEKIEKFTAFPKKFGP
jgi:hypothetical protein